MNTRIRKLAAAFFSLVVGIAPALALTASAIPTKLPIPFGNGAGAGYIRTIPVPSQQSILAGAASLTDGFPPSTFLPIGAGGTPPAGQDFNGILYEISAWVRWQSAGGPVSYDASFSSSIGGYPLGATLNAAQLGTFWISLVDNNLSNPDTGGANWLGGGHVPTGGFIPFAGQVAPPGWLLCYGQAVSRTTYANLFNVVGTAYGVGDGSTTFNLPDMRSRYAVGWDIMGGTPSNRITIAGGGYSAASFALGAGQQNYGLTASQVPSHTHNYSGSSTTNPENANHAHGYTVVNQVSGLVEGGNTGSFSYGATTGGTTGAENATHGHAYGWSGTTDGCGACASATFPTLPPALVSTYIIKY